MQRLRSGLVSRDDSPRLSSLAGRTVILLCSVLFCSFRPATAESGMEKVQLYDLEGHPCIVPVGSTQEIKFLQRTEERCAIGYI